MRVSWRRRMALPALEALQARGRALDVVAQPLDVAEKRLRLERRRHYSAFLLQVLARIHAHSADGAFEPRTEIAHAFAERVRRNVTDPLRDFFLEIGSRYFEQLRVAL